MSMAEEVIPVEELTREELLGYIDAEARKRVGISGRALLWAFKRGELDDPGPVADLLILADLLPENDPVYG